MSQGDSFKSMPVIASPTHYLFQIVREGITFLACTQVEMPLLMGTEFLCRVTDILSDYLGGLNEDLIKDILSLFMRDRLLVKCDIYGEVQVSSLLSGLPDLTLSFANPSMLDDVRLYPCVRFRPWESHQILSFVPPAGQFKLMSYRVKKLTSTPIEVQLQLTSNAGTCCISVMVGVRMILERQLTL